MQAPKKHTCAAYEPFRKMRAVLRKKGHFADPVALAQGLLPYSELGLSYVENVRGVIRAGASGFAVISDLFGGPGIRERAEEFTRIWDEEKRPR